MNDPHVQTLRFRLRTDVGTIYKDDAAPVAYETEAFKATLEKGFLSMSMRDHYATPGEAINRVQPVFADEEVQRRDDQEVQRS